MIARGYANRGSLSPIVKYDMTILWQASIIFTIEEAQTTIPRTGV